MLRKEKKVGARVEGALRGGDQLIVTPIAYFEVLRGLEKRKDQQSLTFIHDFWRRLHYEETSRAIWDEAIRLYVLAVRQNEKREDADTILAAFATSMDATVVTTNEKHFEIFGLSVENWAA